MSANDDSYWQPYALPVQPDPAATTPPEYGYQEARGSAGPLPTPPYLLTPVSGQPAPRRNRKRWPLVTAVVTGTVLLGGGSAYATDNYQASKICSAMKTADAASGANNGATHYIELRSRLKSANRMLFFSSDLKGAIGGLLQDLDRYEALEGEEDRSGMSLPLLREAITKMDSMNGHVRAAQQACNLPARGIPSFNAPPRRPTRSAQRNR